MGLKEAVLNEIEITYRSDTAFQFDVYLNRSSSAATWPTTNSEQFAASTTTTTVKKKFPSEFRATQFEFGIQLPTSLKATNTYLEIYEINISGTVEDRI